MRVDRKERGSVNLAASLNNTFNDIESSRVPQVKVQRSKKEPLKCGCGVHRPCAFWSLCDDLPRARRP